MMSILAFIHAFCEAFVSTSNTKSLDERLFLNCANTLINNKDLARPGPSSTCLPLPIQLPLGSSILQGSQLLVHRSELLI